MNFKSGCILFQSSMMNSFDYRYFYSNLDESLYMKTFLLTILLTTQLQVVAQQRKYYSYINQAEELFVTKHDASCFKSYDRAFQSKARYFAKDAYIAAQIAYYLKDDQHTVGYLKRAFELGLPFSALKAAPIFSNIEKSAVYPQIVATYQSCQKPKFDTATRDEIYQRCFESDSIKFYMGRDPQKIKAFHDSENEFRSYLFVNFLSKGNFPNENMIGIATDSIYNDFLKRFGHIDPWAAAEKQMFGANERNIPIEFELLAKYSLSVLLHSHCSFPNYQKQLLEAVMNGYMQPIEYAILHETSVAWIKQDNPANNCTPSLSKAYYNILPNDPRTKVQTRIADTDLEGLQLVEQNRALIYMQKYSIDQLKFRDQKELGIDFFFDFINR